jgi:hypothetical protein
MADVNAKVAGRSLRNRVVPLGRVQDSRDSGPVSDSKTSDASTPEQPASIALLPPEILFEIINLVAAEGVRKLDVENTLRSCRAIYCAGLPLLFREVTLDKATGAAKLKALDGGFTGIDKTEFVRSLKIPSGLSWTAGMLKVLGKCLLKATRLEFETHGEKIMKSIWEVLQDAPVLRELDLKLSKTAFDALDDETRFPASVRVLRLTPDLGKNNAGFLRMLENHATNLEELEVVRPGNAWRFESTLKELKLEAYPALSTKTLRYKGSSMAEVLYLPTSITSLKLINVYGGTLPKAIVERFRKLEKLETLTISCLHTNALRSLAGSLSSVRKLHLTHVAIGFAPAVYEAAAAALCRPDLEITISFDRAY